MQARSKDFGPGVYAGRIIRNTLRDATVLVDQSVEAGAKRLPGAGITALDSWMRVHQHAVFMYGGIFNQNIDTADRLLRTCADLAESIALLLETNGKVRASPFVLERALGEAVMRLCYIFDSAFPPARTVARMAAYQLETIEGNLRAAEAFGRDGAKEAARARENITEMHRFLSTSGFVLSPGRREPYTVSIAYGGQRENIKFEATAAFRRYLPASAWQWEIGSGVTHGRGWMLSGLMGTSEEEALTSSEEAAMAIAGSALEHADALANAARDHTGVEIDWFLKKNHQRRRGVTTWSGSHQDLAVGHIEYANRGPESA